MGDLSCAKRYTQRAKARFEHVWEIRALEGKESPTREGRGPVARCVPGKRTCRLRDKTAHTSRGLLFGLLAPHFGTSPAAATVPGLRTTSYCSTSGPSGRCSAHGGVEPTSSTSSGWPVPGVDDEIGRAHAGDGPGATRRDDRPRSRRAGVDHARDDPDSLPRPSCIVRDGTGEQDTGKRGKDPVEASHLLRARRARPELVHDALGQREVTFLLPYITGERTGQFGPHGRRRRPETTVAIGPVVVRARCPRPPDVGSGRLVRRLPVAPGQRLAIGGDPHLSHGRDHEGRRPAATDVGVQGAVLGLRVTHAARGGRRQSRLESGRTCEQTERCSYRSFTR
jgi:hypothetical protein